MADSLTVYEHGDESLLTVRAMTGGGVTGSWSEEGWSYTKEDLLAGLTIYADGVPVENVDIIAETTSKDENPNAAILWPHVTDNAFDVLSNEIEVWLSHDLIEKTAVVTYDLEVGKFTQGPNRNDAKVGAAATNLSTYAAEWTDHMEDDCEIIFMSRDEGTVPKLPDLRNGLTSTHTYADLATIPAADVDGTVNNLFIIPITITASAVGTVFEYGDVDNGVSAIFSGGQLRVKAGTAAEAVINDRSHGTTGFLPLNHSFALGIYVNKLGGSLDIYAEGVLIRSVSGTIGDITSLDDGAVGTVNGDYMNSGTYANPTRSGLTIDGDLEHYEAPTINPAITASSQDWFDYGYNTTVREQYYSSWAGEATKYLYTKSDFADVRNPGAVNWCSSNQFAGQLMSWQTGGATQATKHIGVGYKAGETWLDTVNDISSPILESRQSLMDFRTTGVSKLRGVVLFLVEGTDPIDCDWSASALTVAPQPYYLRKISYFFMESGMFNFIGRGSAMTGLGFSLAVNSASTNMHTWRIGGQKFTNTGSNAIGYTSNDVIDASSNVYGHTWGEMCFDRIGASDFRSAGISTGAGDENGRMKRVQFGRSYIRNQYNAGGGENLQAHGVYIKGWVPYLRFKESWHGTGPGGMIKLDTHKKAVVENVVGWSHESGGVGFQNNGTNNGSIWTATTNRDRRVGRHNDHVCIQNFLFANCSDWLTSLSSAIDCEMRKGFIFGPLGALLAFFMDVGNSNSEGEYGGDSYNSGMDQVTMIGTDAVTIRIASTDDRSVNNSQAHHNGYLHRCLIVATGECITFESWTNASQGYADGASAGRITNFRISKSHLFGEISENATLYDDLEEARIAIADAGGSVFPSTTIEGTVEFEGLNPLVDPLLTYFQGLGYDTYTDVEEAIVGSWPNWDSVPTGLSVAEIMAAFKASAKPTNLVASVYGGELPGYPQDAVIPPDPESTGGVGSTRLHPSLARRRFFILDDEDQKDDLLL